MNLYFDWNVWFFFIIKFIKFVVMQQLQEKKFYERKVLGYLDWVIFYFISDRIFDIQELGNVIDLIFYVYLGFLIYI